jgi:tetratricopeptide (TPR) repeat protein
VNESQAFANALKLATPAERAAYLDAACAGNPLLRAGVEALLRAHASDPGFLEQPAGPLGGTVDELPEAGPPNGPLPQPGGTEQPGVVLAGRYKLLEQIGEGGMGTVWMAQQTEPVRRLVALKVIKPGMDSAQVLARFEAERQALALMDHHHIAKVLDAGTTDAGGPFFVMELVKGVPITKFCDERRLTPRQRLELFVPVCAAIQHAHHKGIIHRDLKPANVLVAQYDDQPVPKVIDFGVAKATGQHLTEETLHTGFGAVVGTLEYMSPEQASFNQLDVDTRSDIYALGVLLYELLTGSPPFGRTELEKGGVLEMLRLIREQEPSKPSTKLSTAEGLPTLAANRGTEPRRLTALVKGELDWIVMKALEKDRSRRYESANALATDVQRYLADEPVLACPPSAAYRLRKFARRNKRALATAAVVALAVLLASGAFGWAARDRAGRQAALEREIIRALDDVEDAYRRDRLPEALERLKRAEGFLAGGGGEELGRRVRQWRIDLDLAARLEEIPLERAAAKDGRFDTAEVDRAYREAFRQYGVDTEALDPEEAAQRIRASAVKDRLVATLDDWLLSTPPEKPLGKEGLLAIVRRADPDVWRGRLRDAFQRQDRRAVAELAQDKEVLAQAPATVVLLGAALRCTDQGPLAAAALRQAQRRHPTDFWINYNLASYLSNPAQAGEAVGFARAALTLRPDSRAVYVLLGNALHLQGKPAEAEAEFRAALLLLQPKHAIAHYNLGNALRDQKRLPEAVAAYQEALRLTPKYYAAHVNLAATLVDENKLPEAEAEYREVIGLRPNDPMAHYLFGHFLSRQGRLDEAAAELREAIRLKPDLVEAHHMLRTIYGRQNKLAEVEAEFREIVHLLPNDPMAHASLAGFLLGRGKWAEAETEFREAIHRQSNFAYAHFGLGNALLQQHRLGEAAAEYQQAARLQPSYGQAHVNLGTVLTQQGKLAEAEDAFRNAILVAPKLGAPHGGLGNLHAQSAEWGKAAAAYGRACDLEPGEHWNWYARAVLCLHTGDVEGYRRACRQMLERFGQSGDEVTAERLAKSCLLLPNSVPDAKQVQKLAEKLIEKRPSPSYLMIKGLADYRAGRYTGAIERLKCFYSQANFSAPLHGAAFALLAMAHHRLGHAEEARVALVNARRITNEITARRETRMYYDSSWPDGLHCELLCREAEALLKGAGAGQPAGKEKQTPPAEKPGP